MKNEEDDKLTLQKKFDICMKLKQYDRAKELLICPTCGKKMRNAIDSITKQISPYLWEADCDCEALKGLILSKG